MKTFYFMVRFKQEYWERIKAVGTNEENEWQLLDQFILETDEHGNTDITTLMLNYNALKKRKHEYDIKVVFVGSAKGAKKRATTGRSGFDVEIGNDHGFE